MYDFEGLCSLVAAEIVIMLIIGIDAALDARRSGRIELRSYNRWYLYVFCIAASFAVNHFVETYIYQIATFKMPSAAMEPALLTRDRVKMRLWPYTDKITPSRGDIVVFPYPKDPSTLFIFRIIGLPDEKLEIKNTRVYINGNMLKDRWGSHFIRTRALAQGANLDPVTVPKGSVFVMGDNRDSSNDSRFWGPVEIGNIKGKALYVFISGDKDRIGKPLE